MTIKRSPRRPALLIAISLLGSVVSLRVASATVGEHLTTAGLSLGRTLSEETALLNRLFPSESHEPHPALGEAHHLSLNGARVTVQSGLLPAEATSSVRSILEAVSRDCDEPSERKAQESNALIDPPKVQSELPNEGFLACLKPSHPLSWKGLSRMAEAFSSTGDLDALGHFQGVYVRKNEASLSVLTVETGGGLDVSTMFPQTGDCPGSDHVELPRPPGRRLLSVAHHDSSTLVAYEAESAPALALDAFRRQLEDAGLTVSPPPNASRSPLAFITKADTETFLVTATSAHEQTHLVLARLPH